MQLTQRLEKGGLKKVIEQRGKNNIKIDHGIMANKNEDKRQNSENW